MWKVVPVSTLKVERSQYGDINELVTTGIFFFFLARDLQRNPAEHPFEIVLQRKALRQRSSEMLEVEEERCQHAQALSLPTKATDEPRNGARWQVVGISCICYNRWRVSSNVPCKGTPENMHNHNQLKEISSLY